MATKLKNNFRVRRNYAKIDEVVEVPHLIALQKQSYETFLQKDADPEQRQAIGLERVFKTVFPVKDYNDVATLEFVSYKVGDPKYDIAECRARGCLLYTSPSPRDS